MAKKRTYEEDNTLIECVKWCDWYFNFQFPELLLKQENKKGQLRLVAPLVHTANERKSSPQAGKRLKDKGVRAGYPDFRLEVPMGGSAALVIEMKTAKGRISPNQKHWEAYFNRNKFACNQTAYRVCRSLEEFKAAIRGYMEQ